MKIGYEAKRAFQNFTGLGNYARSLIEILAYHYPKNKYFLYAPKAVKNSRTASLFSFSNVIIRTAPVKLLKSYWRSKGVVKDLIKDKVEVYHGLSAELPSGLKSNGIKAVVTIHDLIFLRYPQYFKFLDRKIYAYKFKKACQNADLIVAISEQTKRDIVHYFGTAEEKIRVVYQGCDSVFYEKQPPLFLESIKSKYELPNEFLLCVGTIENRKNQLLILKALLHLPEHIEVVLVGKSTPYQTLIETFIEDNQLKNRVHILNTVPFEDLPAIYQLAKIFVYPSEFEGFGIPILEALNSEIPVIAAEGSCLEEAGGPDSIYVSPTDERELTNEILMLLNDKPLREKMIASGKNYALNFRAEIIAEKMMHVYTTVLN